MRQVWKYDDILMKEVGVFICFLSPFVAFMVQGFVFIIFHKCEVNYFCNPEQWNN